MDLTAVIDQIRQYCPSLQGRVGGAADFATGVEEVLAFTDPTTGALAYPSCVVMPLADDSDENTLAQGLQQIVTETISVVVEFDASADRRGQTAVSQVEAMKYELFSALLNWHIDLNRSQKGIYYAGGELLDFDRARLFWQFRFSFDAMITDADGFPVEGPPLTNITSTVTSFPTGTTDIVFQATAE